MVASTRCREASVVVLVLLLACGCGGEGQGEASAPGTPAPVVEVTPEPTPAAEPEALEPTTLFHLVLDEQTGAPSLPSRSPLARDLAPLPEGTPTAEVLAWDAAPTAVVEGVRSLEAGFGVPGGALVLVQWNLSWGPDGASGRTRRWGLCALPCTVQDGFVATEANHPVHPVTAPRALFAMRPGVHDVGVRLHDGVLEVVHGEAPLWQAGAAGDPISASGEQTWPVMDARGLLAGEETSGSHRQLQVLTVESRPFELTGASEPPTSEIRVLPRLGVSPSPVQRLAVEGVEEIWPWPGGATFEGGFSARPNPGNDGLKLDRIEHEIRWTPTVRQAGDGRAEFPIYSLAGASRKLEVQPFPEGAAVLGGTVACDGRVVVAAGTDFEPERRGRQIADMFGHYNELLPLPAVPADEAAIATGAVKKAAPWVVYSAPEAVGVLPGSAGRRAHSLAVDDDLDEVESVVMAWSRLQLAPRIDNRSPAALDFLRWAEAKLVPDRIDASIFTHVFVAGGDDVEQVWREWLTDPARDGPDPAAFVSFVQTQLPDLAEELRRSLAVRRWAVEGAPEPLELEPGASSLQLTLEDPGPAGAVVALLLPEGAGLEPVQVEAQPQRGGGEVHWAGVLIEERRWQEALSDPAARAALGEGLSPTRGIVTEEQQEEPATPPAAPSQLRGQYGGARVRARPKPAEAEPVTLTLRHEDRPVGRSVVLLTAWGEPGWKTRLSITSAVPMPEPVPDAAPELLDGPAPDGALAPDQEPATGAEPPALAE